MECCKEADFDGPFNDAGKKCLAAQFASYEKNGVVCCGVIWAADEAVLFFIVISTSKNRVGEKSNIVRIFQRKVHWNS